MAVGAKELPKDSYIIPAELAIRAMRDSGYRNTAYALAELIDNSVQAKASLVELICNEEIVQVNDRKRRRLKSIGVLDNGTGMTPDLLRHALQFGYGTHLDDRSGIGRFGIGLPNASISQGRRVDIWTWQRGPTNAVRCYLDVDEIEAGTMTMIPEPIAEALPEPWRTLSTGLGTTGTLVVWTKFDEERLTWKGAKATLDNTATLVGRMYRKFLAAGSLRLRLCVAEDGKLVKEHDALVNDPLYLLTPSATPAPFNVTAMFQRFGEADEDFPIVFGGKTHVVCVRASWATKETLPADGTNRGDKDYGKHAAKNIGVSIVRAGRELDLDPSWTISYDPRERWWGLEVEFPPELDEIFGVTNNKQAATTFSHMVNFDWKTEAEPGESYSDFLRRLTEEGDHRAPLIEIVGYIEKTLSMMRHGIEDQGKGRRGPGKRHDDTNVEDRASTKFKERAEAGHAAPSDNEVFNADAQDKLVEDLVKEKKYEEDVAKEIAAAVLLRRRKVIFVEAASDMDAFFAVESRPGGVTEIVFNRSHPAYDLLIRTLDGDTTNATERDLVGRIVNASDTIKMLFAAWARQELEDVPNRERIRRMRQDWGRMARDFLTDERED